MKWLAFVLGLVLAGPAAAGLPCTPTNRDDGADRAAVAAATRPLEAAHKARVDALDARPAPGGSVFEAQQAAYEADLRAALRPLVERGNAAAMFRLAVLHRESGGGDRDPEWLRLVKCASDLGEPQAQVEQFRVLWHDKGDGSFAAIQRNRAAALDLAGRAAAQGELGAIGAVGVYIGFGRHQYPLDPDLGRRALELCARMGDRFCQARLLDAAEAGQPIAPKDPTDSYIFAELAAQAQPGMYARYVPVLRARLSDSQLMAATEALFEWKPAEWGEVRAEWTAIRRDILARGCPASVSCRHGQLCECPA